MFVESAHLYVLKNIMAGIYWLVELGPGALAEIISVGEKNSYRFLTLSKRRQATNFTLSML